MKKETYVPVEMDGVSLGRYNGSEGIIPGNLSDFFPFLDISVILVPNSFDGRIIFIKKPPSMIFHDKIECMAFSKLFGKASYF
ncbi:hypothetical protein V1499_22895 [Neobacillus sp. SCS-31]|uniref:hypothetical protein n=1 Tax=Neobacillus oceani TaxID=3115292 RepID=UPI003905E3DB